MPVVGAGGVAAEEGAVGESDPAPHALNSDITAQNAHLRAIFRTTCDCLGMSKAVWPMSKT